MSGCSRCLGTCRFELTLSSLTQETARRNDMPSILATCGGHCECATCHVHIPPLSSSSASAVADPANDRKPLALPQSAPIPEMKDEEDEQLEFAIGANDDSRSVAVPRTLGAAPVRAPKSQSNSKRTLLTYLFRAGSPARFPSRKSSQNGSRRADESSSLVTRRNNSQDTLQPLHFVESPLLQLISQPSSL